MQVKAIPREKMDAWPLSEAGLPVRVVNAVRDVPIQTAGQLRTLPDSDLLKLRSLGRISLGHVHAFFKLCAQIEQGRLRFASIQEVFALRLDDSERAVLAARYGLDRDSEKVGRHHVTLQKIADTAQITRERVRQIQDAGLLNLRSRLAQACLQPFYEYLSAQLDLKGGISSCKDLTALRSEPALGGLNPCGIMQLLSDANPARLVSCHDFFTTFPLGFVQKLEARLVALLEEAGAPLTLDELCKKAGPETLGPLRHPGEAIGCLLDHCPEVAVTADQRYFLYRNGAQVFVAEILSRMERPAHYRKVTTAFNEALKPGKRKGAGFMLGLLIATPRCTRVDRGIYDLKAE